MARLGKLGYPLYCDGIEWTSLLSRQLTGGAAMWDTNTSPTAVSPLGGVFGGLGNPLLVTQQASPNMSVLVNAGYCAVPHATQGHGVYMFGQLTQGTLTDRDQRRRVDRLDLIMARVYDLGNSSSYCDVEVVAGNRGHGPAGHAGHVDPAGRRHGGPGGEQHRHGEHHRQADLHGRARRHPPRSIRGGTRGHGGPVHLQHDQRDALRRRRRLRRDQRRGHLHRDIGQPGPHRPSGRHTGGGSATGRRRASITTTSVLRVRRGRLRRLRRSRRRSTADGATDYAIDVKWGMAVPEAAVDASSPSITQRPVPDHDLPSTAGPGHRVPVLLGVGRGHAAG